MIATYMDRLHKTSELRTFGTQRKNILAGSMDNEIHILREHDLVSKRSSGASQLNVASLLRACARFPVGGP